MVFIIGVEVGWHLIAVILILKIALRLINDYSTNHAKMIKMNIIIIILYSYIF